MGFALTASDREKRRARILERIKQSAPKRAEELLQPGVIADVRDMTNTALALLVADGDPRVAEKLLSKAFSLQDMDPDSPTFGYVPWREGDEDIKRDPNSIEFATHSMGPILFLYRNRLSAGFKKKISPHIKAAFNALRSHHPPVWYTNIYLMNTINMILMGEATRDKEAAADGYAQLDIWINYTCKAGIHEYDSPTYYAVDLDSLSVGYLLAKQREGKAKLKAILDCFWSDLCANFFPANKRLAGPHSRNYDFLGGTGGLNPIYWLEGLINEDPNAGGAYLYLGSSEDGYHPSEEILSLAELPERVIQSRWDIAPGGDRYSYMTPDFVIGGASKYYEPQERPIAAEFASDKELPVITVIADTFDKPYGKARIIDGCGHSKPFHWPSNAACVQEKGTMMALLDLDPASMKSTETLATNIILPAKADAIAIDGKQVKTDKPFKKLGGPGSVVGVREGNAGIAIRIFRADGCADQEPEFVLQAEDHGLEFGAMRYSVYHYRGPETVLKDKHARVGILFVAARCESDADFKRLMQQAKDAEIEEYYDIRKSWQVKATIGDLVLQAGRDLKHRGILYRRVNGKAIPIERLMVNGIDLAGPLLDRL